MRRWTLGAVTAVAASVLLVGIYPLASYAGVSRGGPTSWLTVVSSPGDPIGRGLTWTFDNTDGAAGLSGGEADVTYRLSTSYGTGMTDYEVEITAPPGHRLTTGSYKNAHRAGYSGSNPGIWVAGEGRGCNDDTGSFFINSISTDQLGIVIAIDVSFTQYCDGAKAPLRGRLRYQTPELPTLSTSRPATVQGQPTTLTAHAHAGTAVTFMDGKNRIGSAKADRDGLARLTTSRLKTGIHHLTAQAGKSGSATVTQRVYTNYTSFWFQSVAGNAVGQGLSAAYTPAWTTMTIYGTLKQLTVSIVGTADWTVFLVAPKHSTLKEKTYPVTTGIPTRTAPSLDMEGGGRSCERPHGAVSITKLRTAADGSIASVALSFVLYCNDAETYPLHGHVHLAAD